ALSPHITFDERLRIVRSAGFGKEVQKRLALGTAIASADNKQTHYRRAQAARDAIKADFERIFQDEGIDFLISSTSVSGPSLLTERGLDDDPEDDAVHLDQMMKNEEWATDFLTVPA